MSDHNSISRTIRRKGIQATRREIATYADPIYQITQLKYLYRLFLERLQTWTSMQWSKTLTWILKKISYIKKV